MIIYIIEMVIIKHSKMNLVETPGWEKRWGARHGKKELDELPYSKFLSFCGVYLLKNA